MILSSSIVTAGEIVVQPGDSIQAAVDTAAPGDQVIIKPGTYTENIKVAKPDLTIKSESENPTDTIIVTGDPALDVFTLESSNITISGLKITDAGIGHAGIYLHQCNTCKVEDNKVLNNSIGVYVKNSGNNFILNNLVGKSNKAIEIEQSNFNTVSGNRASKNKLGIDLLNANYNNISNNTISENRVYGISLLASISNSILENHAFNNMRGIHLGNSDGNTILSNSIYSNEVYGLFICPKSDKNLAYNNYFNNTDNVEANNGTDNTYNIKKIEGTNIVGGPSLAGNYWAKPDGTGFSETAVDADGDGVADNKYDFENSSYIDYMPLVALKQAQLTLPVANFSVNTTGGSAPLAVLFTDLSENKTGITWDFENDGNIDTPEENPIHTYMTPGIYVVNLTASNQNGTSSKVLTISVISENETEKENSSMDMPDFKLLYGILGLLAIWFYKRNA